MFGGLWNIPEGVGEGRVVVEGLWGSDVVGGGSYCGRLVPAASGSSYLLFVCGRRVLGISGQQQEDNERRLGKRLTFSRRLICHIQHHAQSIQVGYGQAQIQRLQLATLHTLNSKLRNTLERLENMKPSLH